MSVDQAKKLSLKKSYEFGATHGLEREVTEIQKMPVKWDRKYTSTVRRGYIVALFEKHGLLEGFKDDSWSYGNNPAGQTQCRFYLRIKADYEDYQASRSPEPSDDDDEIDDEIEADDDNEIEKSSPGSERALEFALESHLRDFLARNLALIETGLSLYASPERDGVEFPVERGRIDLLAVDRNGTFVVIELKLSQGRNKTLGQLLYYMGWIDQRLGRGPCRGIIIASDITSELSIAAARVPGVSLAKYRMSFTIETA